MHDRAIIKSTKVPYHVKELADTAKVTTDAFRYYTRERLLKPKRVGSNQYKL